MLSIETYKIRLDSGLSILEFNYQLLQAYDFLELHRRYDCELQMGGDDQWANIISGTDLIRVNDEKFVVLEDNVRTPSGASYMIENRETMLHMFPELFTRIPVKSVSNYPEQLLQILIASAPASATARTMD